MYTQTEQAKKNERERKGIASCNRPKLASDNHVGLESDHQAKGLIGIGMSCCFMLCSTTSANIINQNLLTGFGSGTYPSVSDKLL